MHNAGQIIMAMIILQLPQLMYYMGVLMLVAIFTGALTGTLAKLLMKHLPLDNPQLKQKMGK